ncbi:DUF732 domain-containing protein [Mycobacterium sp. DL99]|uniref:DUF732 domain-containing protein n=1 Tax=Mycobacterium sp. DL99 TaxID=2528957 RepID=UPI00336C153F
MTVTTVVVQSTVQVPQAAPTPEPGILPPAVVESLDRQFIASLRVKGWAVVDEASAAHDAHVTCAFLQQGMPRGLVNAKYAEASGSGIVQADQFTLTAMQTYPNCP